MKKILFIMSMITVAFSGMAQKVEDKPEVKGETSESLAAVKLANQILRYGYENKSTLFRRIPLRHSRPPKKEKLLTRAKLMERKRRFHSTTNQSLPMQKHLLTVTPIFLLLSTTSMQKQKAHNVAILMVRHAITPPSMAIVIWITLQVLWLIN